MFHTNRAINLCLKLIFLFIDLLWFRKNPCLWVIAIGHVDRFDGNVRAIYELTRDDPDLCSPAQIKVIVSPKDEDAVEDCHLVRWGSLEHFLTLLRAGCILFHHNYNDVGLIALPLWRWNFRVSHGIHYKRVERARSVPGVVTRWFLSTRNIIPHHFVSSRLDAMSAVAYFHLYLSDVIITGAAKNDLLLNKSLPQNLRHQEEELIRQLRGRRLITYAPTWRNNGESYRFTPSEVLQLSAFLEKTNTVFGFAGHTYLQERHIPAGDAFLDLNIFDIDVQVLLRNTELLVSDYSSIWIDFLLTRRPIILFQYDAKEYISDRDFLFDIDIFSPPTKCLDFSELMTALEQPPKVIPDYLRKAFHCFEDGRNGKRTIEMVKSFVRP